MWAGTGFPIAFKWTLSNREEPPLTDLNILGISGSLRAGSFNTALLRNAQKHAPAGMTVNLLRELLTALHDQIRG
jgi:hypothetical protein